MSSTPQEHGFDLENTYLHLDGPAAVLVRSPGVLLALTYGIGTQHRET